MKKLNKKFISIIGFIIIVILGSIIYFKPMTLSNYVDDKSILQFAETHKGMTYGGEFTFDSNNFKINDEQKKEILQIFNNFPYTRNLTTFFSRKMSTFERSLSIATFSETSCGDIIIVNDNNQLFFKNKIYTMKNSSDFIDQILDIINK